MSFLVYKHKNEVLQADIKQELQRRKELKRVIQEAKARYETQLQTSKRYKTNSCLVITYF